MLLLLAFVALLGYSWWQHKHPTAKSPSTTRQTTINPPIPVAIDVPPPLPVAPPVTVTPPPATNTVIPPNPESDHAAGEFPRPVRGGLELQVALARLGISPGSVDGAIGSQTHSAIAAFQRSENLPPTGVLDASLKAALKLDGPLLTTYTVTSNDLARLQPLGKTWLEKSQQSALEYETLLELVAEKAHAHPALVKQFNPGIDWDHVSPGTVLQIPDIQYPPITDKAALIIIHLSDKYLEAFDQDTNLLVHFPCSIAARVEKRPVGELHVAVVAPNPNYTFDPEVFPESPEAQAVGHKLVLPPGPNNPVGIAWIGLDKTGYGIHGTPAPEQVGRTESHGCFRLANWDAAYLSKLAWVGLRVEVVP